MEESIIKRRGVVLLFGFIVLAFTFTAFMFSGYAYADDVESGKKVYQKYCVICHGTKGDGKGLVGIIHRVEKSGLTWNVYPRDFTVGVYKFRSTPTGCLPDDKDLLRIITGGIPRSGMPSHEDVSLNERKAVMAYLKTLSPRWVEEDPCSTIALSKPQWVGSAESVNKGEKVFKDMKCFECHGYEGKGDGPKAGELKDDWGDKILPFNFTSGTLKRGSAPEDVYMTFTTGLDGTGMPSYEDSLKEDDRWHLVSYTLKLMGKVQ